MKQALTAIMIALFLGVAVSAQAEYHTEVKVVPSKEPGQFFVEFKIIPKDKNDKSNLLSAPQQMIVSEGQEGKMKVIDDQEEVVLVCTALVAETDKGIEATTTITLRKNNDEKLSTYNSIIIEN